MKWNERFPSLSGVLIQSSCTSDGSYRHEVASRSHLFIMNTRRKRRSGSPLITYACGVSDKDADTVLSVCGNERQPSRQSSAISKQTQPRRSRRTRESPMTTYRISFPSFAMVHPEEDRPTVAAEAHAVIQEAKDAG